MKESHLGSIFYGFIVVLWWCFRGLFIIDDKSVIRQITINDMGVGRSVDEVLRLLDAIQFSDSHGEVCPANWRKGDKTIKPTIKESHWTEPLAWIDFRHLMWRLLDSFGFFWIRGVFVIDLYVLVIDLWCLLSIYVCSLSIVYVRYRLLSDYYRFCISLSIWKVFELCSILIVLLVGKWHCGVYCLTVGRVTQFWWFGVGWQVTYWNID